MSWRCPVPTDKPLKSRSYLPFNIAIAKICVAIRLAEDGKRMSEI